MTFILLLLMHAVKDTNLKANHNSLLSVLLMLLAVKDTNLKANHNLTLKRPGQTPGC